jgi:hypothetical protein
MNVEIGAGAALFPEKEYINRIAVAVQSQSNELTRGPPELNQHFPLHGEFTSAQQRCLTLN